MIEGVPIPTFAPPQTAVTPGPQTSKPDAGTTSSSKPDTSAPATRLLVEPNGAEGYLYRLVDVVTGRVLAELPRERADDLKASPTYAAGALVATTA